VGSRSSEVLVRLIPVESPCPVFVTNSLRDRPYSRDEVRLYCNWNQELYRPKPDDKLRQVIKGFRSEIDEKAKAIRTASLDLVALVASWSYLSACHRTLLQVLELQDQSAPLAARLVQASAGTRLGFWEPLSRQWNWRAIASGSSSIRRLFSPALFGSVDQILLLAKLRQHGSCQELRAPFADVIIREDPLLGINTEVPRARRVLGGIMQECSLNIERWRGLLINRLTTFSPPTKYLTSASLLGSGTSAHTISKRKP
jgi:hypothetical protein